MADDVAIVRKRVELLWKAIENRCAPGGTIRIEEYSDDEWCEEYASLDEYFLEVLTWGPYPPNRQRKVADSLISVFRSVGRGLDELSEADLDRLIELLPLRNARGGRQGWQQAYLRRLVTYLRAENITLTQFVGLLVKLPPASARAEFQRVLNTDEEKIPGCFLRDALKLDLFPIDRHVGTVLEAWGLPWDSSAIEASCSAHGIPTRVMARVVVSNADELIQDAKKFNLEPLA